MDKDKLSPELRKKWEMAEARVAAKKFAASIPTGFMIPVPDETLNKLTDEQIIEFFGWLERHNYRNDKGKWYRV